MLSGLPGTGKTTLARALVGALAEFKVRHVQSDYIRKQLYPNPAYSDAENVHVHATVRQAIAQALLANQVVIHDSTNLREEYRQWAFDITGSLGGQVLIVHLVAQEATIRARLEERAMHGDSLSDADWNVYKLLRSIEEPVAGDHFRFVTDGDWDSEFAQLSEQIVSLIEMKA